MVILPPDAKHAKTIAVCTDPISFSSPLTPLSKLTGSAPKGPSPTLTLYPVVTSPLISSICEGWPQPSPHSRFKPYSPLLISHSSFPTPHFPHLISHTWFPATHKTHPTPFTAQPTNFTTNPLPSPLISQLSHLPSHFSPLTSHLSPLTSHLSLMSSHLLTCTSHPSMTFTLYDLTQNGVNSLLRWSSLCKYLTMSVTATRAHSRWRFYAVSHADGGELVVSLSLFFCVACPPLIFKFLSTIKSTLCLCDHCMPHRIRVIIPFHPPPPPPFHPPPPPPPCHQWLTEQSVNRYMVF